MCETLFTIVAVVPLTERFTPNDDQIGTLALKVNVNTSELTFLMRGSRGRSRAPPRKFTLI